MSKQRVGRPERPTSQPMTLRLAAPTIHTPGFLAFCEKAPQYVETLNQIEARGAAIFTAKEAGLMTEMFLHFTPLPPMSEPPSEADLAAIEAAREQQRAVVQRCSAYQLAEGIQAIMPQLKALLEAQLPTTK